MVDPRKKSRRLKSCIPTSASSLDPRGIFCALWSRLADEVTPRPSAAGRGVDFRSCAKRQTRRLKGLGTAAPQYDSEHFRSAHRTAHTPPRMPILTEGQAAF